MLAAKAIADPVRRDILVLLRARALTAGDIAQRFEISRPAVSRHLRVLREAGVVTADAHGRERMYRLEPAPLAELAGWLLQFSQRWEQRLDALETEVYRTRRDTRRERGATSARKENSA
ncbi:MAG: metalloregulator ArsR/SmtB family transcription factor [Jiangellaceae bacterium]